MSERSEAAERARTYLAQARLKSAAARQLALAAQQVAAVAYDAATETVAKRLTSLAAVAMKEAELLAAYTDHELTLAETATA